MPGLTGDIILEQAQAMGLMIHGQLVNLSPQQWVELQSRCEQALGLSRGWEEEGYKEVVELAKKEGWGKTFGPGAKGGYRKKGKPTGDVDIALKTELSLEGTLFDD